MPAEDTAVTTWVQQLMTMQECMSQININTAADLTAFYSQKPGNLLLSDTETETFGAAFFDRTQIPITDQHFQDATSFHDLLDRCFRPLLGTVVDLMRAVAIEQNPALGGTPANSFGMVGAGQAFPQPVLDILCQRLSNTLTPLFTVGSARETSLRTAAGKNGATVTSCAQACV